MKFSPRIRIVAGLAACVTALSILPAHAATAYTTAAVTLRAGTNTGTAALLTVPAGAAVNVQCQARGQSIQGTYNSDWWAKVNWGGRTGYLSRAYVRVPHGTNVPTCSSGGGSTTPPPTGVRGGPISRSEVIARGRNWVQRRVPYSMYHYATEANGSFKYRTDCSGFVSMALRLRDSAGTVNLPNFGIYWINKNDLRPGDLVGNMGKGTEGPNGHVVIFLGWVDGSRTRFYSMEQTGGIGANEQIRSWGTANWNRNAWRYNKITG